jgi:hypothetical protein
VLHTFFLVTNLVRFDRPAVKVLANFRKPGSAEANMHDVKSALNMQQSSTNRGDFSALNVMVRIEVCLLSIYKLMLEVAATLTLHANQFTAHLGDTANRW